MPREEKLLKKGRLRYAYDALSPKVQEAVREDFHLLLEENRNLDNYMKKHMYEAILPSVAMYRTLPDYGYRKAEAFLIIRKSVLKTAEPTKRLIQKAGKLPFFFPFFSRLCRLSMQEAYCGEEWSFTWNKVTKDVIDWECHACIYVNRFTGYGMGELTCIFCESDDVVYGSIPNVRWGRTQTMGRGAEYCDFKFFKERGSHEWKK